MALTQKCQYAIRAIYELALRRDGGPCKIGAVAEAQCIPVRFLENILGELKSSGFVDSVRGKDGGYLLLRSPSDITVGEIIRSIEGPLGPVECSPKFEADCAVYEGCVFRPLWDRAREALEEVYDGTTIQDLVDNTVEGCKIHPQGCGKRQEKLKYT